MIEDAKIKWNKQKKESVAKKDTCEYLEIQQPNTVYPKNGEKGK
jgi:hypothetical protein